MRTLLFSVAALLLIGCSERPITKTTKTTEAIKPSLNIIDIPRKKDVPVEKKLMVMMPLLRSETPKDTFPGRYVMRFSGPGQGATGWNFTEDGKAIEDGDIMGRWEHKDNQIVITYDNENFGTAVLDVKDTDHLEGQNRHKSGLTFDWRLERIKEQPNDYTDVYKLIDNNLVEIKFLHKTMNEFVVEAVPVDEQKLITPFAIPAGCLFAPTNTNCQNIVTLRTCIVDKLREPLKIPTACANREKPFGPSPGYMIRKLPDEAPVRKMCEELSHSPCGIGGCQQRIWRVSTQHPIQLQD